MASSRSLAQRSTTATSRNSRGIIAIALSIVLVIGGVLAVQSILSKDAREGDQEIQRPQLGRGDGIESSFGPSLNQPVPASVRDEVGLTDDRGHPGATVDSDVSGAISTDVSVLDSDKPARSTVKSETNTITVVAVNERWDEEAPIVGYSIAVVPSGADFSQVTSYAFEDGASRIVLELADGEYTICMVDNEGGFGHYKGLHVDGAPQVARLAVASSFAVMVTYHDSDRMDPLEGVAVHLATGGHPFITRQKDVESVITTDASGVALFESVPATNLRFRAAKAGYESVEISLPFPGNWTAEDGVVDFGDLSLVRVVNVGFQLVGDDGIGDWTSYQISHRHDGEKISFNSEGRATLSAAHDYGSLYVKLWGPDNWGEVRTLENGLPAEGEYHELYVGGDGALEVDLRLSEKAEMITAGGIFNLTAYFVAQNGDLVASSRDLDGEGVYELRGIDGPEVMLVVQNQDDGAAIPWKTAKVEMQNEGVTTCIMRIDERPKELRVLNDLGEPLSDVTVRVRELPDRTRWLATSQSGAEGIAKVPRTSTKCDVMYSWWTSGGLYATGIGFAPDLASSGITEEVLGPMRDTSIILEVIGGARSGVRFGVAGPASNDTLLILDTDEDGRAGPILMSEGSRASFALESEELWVDRPRAEFKPGENHVIAYEQGFLAASEDVDWSSIQSVRTNTPIEEWIVSGRIVPTVGPRGETQVFVPIGRYTVIRSPGVDPHEVVVTAGEVTDVGL